jgi:hypothetical protein
MQALKAAGEELQTLIICDRSVPRHVAAPLAATLPMLRGLRRLALTPRLPGAACASDAIRQVAPSLRSCMALECLALQHMHLDAGATTALLGALGALSKLQELQLPTLHVSRAGMRQISSIAALTALTLLDTQWRLLDAKELSGGQAFQAVLQMLPRLCSLLPGPW